MSPTIAPRVTGTAGDLALTHVEPHPRMRRWYPNPAAAPMASPMADRSSGCIAILYVPRALECSEGCALPAALWPYGLEALRRYGLWGVAALRRWDLRPWGIAALLAAHRTPNESEIRNPKSKPIRLPTSGSDAHIGRGGYWERRRSRSTSHRLGSLERDRRSRR